MCHAENCDFDPQFELFGVAEPSECPDAPWIRENWHTGFHNAAKIGEIEQPMVPKPPHFIENDATWRWQGVSQDMAEWFFDRTVIGARKHICPHTGVIAIIFLADTGEQYVADDFNLADLFCEPRSTADALYRLPAIMTLQIRIIRARKVDQIRGKL